MSVRSQRITLRDIRVATQTVYDCRDLWADPAAWQTLVMERATSLAGCRVGLYFEMADRAGISANHWLAAHDVGWNSVSERKTVVEGLAQFPLRYSALWAAFADTLATTNRTTTGVTLRQQRLIDTPAWQASEMYDRHIRPSRLGEAMLSAVWLPRFDCWSAWSLVTERGESSHTARGERLIRYLHQQIAPMIGTRLSTWRDRNLSDLSATRRRVLEALLDGYSETEIAQRSFRSRAAVHEHVTAIYRHFDVRSRGELGAFVRRQTPAPAPRARLRLHPRNGLTAPGRSRLQAKKRSTVICKVVASGSEQSTLACPDEPFENAVNSDGH